MYVTKGGKIQKIDEGALPYWKSLGWALDADDDGQPESGTYASLQSGLGPALPRQRQPQVSMISAFQSGHGWTVLGGGTATWNLNDTSDYFAGSQCISAVTAANGQISSIRSPALTLDLSANRDLVLWFKVDNLDKLKTIQFTLSTGNFASYQQGVIYDGTVHAAPQESWRSGEWIPFRFNYSDITSTVGTPNKASIDKLQIGIADDGTGPITVKFGGIGHYPRASALPSGAISLTFDDCYTAHYTVAAPYLARYGYAGSEFVIVDRSDPAVNGQTPQLTVAQLRAMQDKYGWEIAGHAWTTANHTAGLGNLADDIVDQELRDSKAWLIRNGFLRGADQFAWPTGQHNASSDAIAARYFCCARSVCRTPMEVVQPGTPMAMRACTVAAGWTLAQAKAWVDQAVASGCWLNIVFHNLVASGATGNDWLISDFQALIDYIATKSVPVLPQGDVWRAAA